MNETTNLDYADESPLRTEEPFTSDQKGPGHPTNSPESGLVSLGDSSSLANDSVSANPEMDPEQWEREVESVAVSDDPFRIYLGEIGRVSLLKPAEEWALGRKIEAYKPLDELQTQLTSCDGRLPSAWVCVLEVLQRLCDSEPLVNALSSYLEFEAEPTVSEIISDPRMRAALDGQLSEEMLGFIDQTLDEDPEHVTESAMALSLDRYLLPEEVFAVLDRKLPLSSLRARLRNSGASEKLKSLESSFHSCLERAKDDGVRARRQMAEANLRLVVSIARKFTGKGMAMHDLVQEGNIGLMRAADRFDYRKGYRFSTYATWWIRQGISRGIGDQARTIRVPIHMLGHINRLRSASQRLVQEYGREPTSEEIGEVMGIDADEVRTMMKVAQQPSYLETPVGEADSRLEDFIADDGSLTSTEEASSAMLKDELE